MSSVVQPSAFLYVAVRPGGGRKVGLRQAGSIPALAHSLRMENQLLLKTWRVPGWAGAKEGDLSLKDQATLNEQLGQLLSRGVPLVEALEVAAATVQSKTRPRINRMKEMVASGTSFSEACRIVGGFDNVNIAVYRGAERTGDLAGAAKELAHTARRRLAVSSQAATMMIYPAIVLTISMLVSTLMMMVVVPMMADGLAKSDIELPGYSKIVFGTGTWMHEHAMFIGVVALCAALAAIVGRVLVKGFLQTMMRRLPIIRDVVLAQESARFFAVMGAMTRTGVPLADALGVSNQAVKHPVLRRQLDRLRTRLIEGGLLRVLIEEAVALPVATRRLLIAAERSGDLETAFGTLAGDMADEVERTSRRFLAVMEPCLIILMFLIIGSLLMAIMLPMLTMASHVGG